MCQGATLSIVVVGAGRVGRAVVEQLTSGASTMRDRCGVAMRLVGMADRSAVLHDATGLSETAIRSALQSKRAGESLAGLSPGGESIPPDRLPALAGPGIVFVDATADPHMGKVWRDVLAAGGSVVLANKYPLCDLWKESAPLYEHPRLRYEATVGAGLPVISTLRRLLDSGDRITGIDASVSGTLAYLMNRLSDGTALSTAVGEAVEAGYAEPDPREDLRGADAARKALILARTLGRPIEPSQVGSECLHPDDLDRCDLSEFLRKLPANDEAWSTRVSDAAQEGRTLRYLVSLAGEDEPIRVGVQALDRANPFASSPGTGNRFEIHTERYKDESLAISGPGAGAAVTATGILGDLIELAALAQKDGP